MTQRRTLVLLALGTVALTGCGGRASEPRAAAPRADGSSSPLPAILVQDVTADRSVALNSFIPSDRPTLLWFWAPH